MVAKKTAVKESTVRKTPAKKTTPKRKKPAPAITPADLLDAVPLDADEELDAEPAPTHSWDDLYRAYGPPTADDLRLYGVNLPPEELVQRGNRIATSRVLSDYLRWCGQIHDWRMRTKDAPVRVLGFSESFFRVVIDDGRKLVELSARQAKEAAATKVLSKGDAAAIQRLTRSVRRDYDELYAALGHGVRDDIALSAKLASAFSRASAPALLTASVAVVLGMAENILKNPKTPMAARLIDSGITPDLLAQLAKDNTELKTLHTRVAGPKVDPAVTQRALDIQDGVCLVHLEALRDAFAAGRKKNPSLPQLIANATRATLGGRRRRPTPAPAQTCPSTPETTE